jgi:murein DD-endopeptidase MepM/ murein hydrolase activator NlpD
MSRRRHLLLGVLVTILAGALSIRHLTGTVPNSEPLPATAKPQPIEASLLPITEHLSINSGDTLDKILGRVGLDTNSRQEILGAMGKVFDVRKIRAGRDLLLSRFQKTGELKSIEYVVDPDHKVQLTREDGVSSAEMIEIPGTLKETSVCGTLEDSLSVSFERIGESSTLAGRMADIFSFDIDFYRDPQPGDKFCLLVEKKVYDNGQPPTYRRILAGKYINAGTTYDAYLFNDGGADQGGTKGKGSYYSGDGKALMAAFLRSPLEFDARISSHFSSSRFHPVLHEVRAHNGTDYAAPTGTPVRAVGSGKVASAAYSESSGNMVAIDHADGYRTQYLHLSKMLVRVGDRVEQGEHIGLVGATGLATGPHVDIRISKSGKYMDWERMRAPRTVTLTAAQKQAFNQQREHYLALMDAPAKPFAPVVATQQAPAANKTAPTPAP